MLNEINLKFKDYKDLSYYETGNEYLDLYLKGKFVGYLVIYIDKENSNREYICINSEIVYLDTLEKINNN